MNWLVFTSIAYFIIAVQVIVDKFLISSKRISHPAIYAFYSGILSLATTALFPLGAHPVSASFFGLYFLTGIIFFFSILILFFAYQKAEVSRVTVVVGAVMPIATYVFSLLLGSESLNVRQIFGAFVLILGGILISWEFSPEIRRKFFDGFFLSIAAGILLAAAYSLMKFFYASDNFINVFVWSRLGLGSGALTLFLWPSWRKKIISSLSGFKKPKKENRRTGLLFIFNKILGGFGSILLNFSMSLGSVTVINALVSLEYAFVFILGILFSIWFHHIFEEKRGWKDILQKISAILIIALGLALVAV